MAATTKWLQKGKENVYMGLFGDLEAVTLYAVLVTSGKTIQQQTDEHYSDISANESAGAGYTAGGQLLTGVAVTSSSLVVKIDADDPSWVASTIPDARSCYILRRVGGAPAATDHLLCYIDFGEVKSSSGTTFPVTFASGGILDDTIA
jgi:hypothetical protein